MTTPTIYIVSDGRPGHLSQSRGLAAAIGRLIEVQIEEIDAAKVPRRKGGGQPKPGLVLAAGRGTFTDAQRLAGHVYSMRSVVLMNPGWWWRKSFDLCIIPRHDGVPESDRVVTTEGALNPITPAANASPTEGLILIGGPSKHHRWEDESLIAQLHTLLARDHETRWTVTGSRRTPDATDKLLRECAQQHPDRFVYTPASQTPRDWVAEQLQRCGVVWVTEDSVSMVYESLTAGARVGLIDVPRRRVSKPGRVVGEVVSLIERGWVTAFDQWIDGKPLPEHQPPLAEADRVADVILSRWPNLTG